MDLLTLPGVFDPLSDSWALARAARAEHLGPGRAALDLCTGSGVVALSAATTGASVTAVDVSRRALWTVRLNAWRHGLRVATRRGRLFEPIAGDRFDLVTANPPYVPSADGSLPRRGASRAWEAGPDGRAVLDRVCDDVAAHLRPGGVVLLVHSSLVDEHATIERLRTAGLLEAAVVDRRRGPLGPLMREQQAAGRLPADLDEEDVVIVRAVAPDWDL